MRAIGRTTRMLQEAIEKARSGRAVYVLSANSTHAQQLELRCSELCSQYKLLGIKFETPESLGSGFDWRYMRLPGAHPNCLLLVDHFAIEQHFFEMLKMLHSYDSA